MHAFGAGGIYSRHDVEVATGGKAVVGVIRRGEIRRRWSCTLAAAGRCAIEVVGDCADGDAPTSATKPVLVTPIRSVGVPGKVLTGTSAGSLKPAALYAWIRYDS